jgi:hypothetical protein
MVDTVNVRTNLTNYISLFTDSIRDLFERLNFQETLDPLELNNLLYVVFRFLNRC